MTPVGRGPRPGRVREALRSLAGSSGGEPPDRRLEDLQTRIERLESVVEGLQDALYRETRRQDERLDDLNKRTQPGEIARALSEDARKRGL